MAYTAQVGSMCYTNFKAAVHPVIENAAINLFVLCQLFRSRYPGISLTSACPLYRSSTAHVKGTPKFFRFIIGAKNF